MGLPEAFQFQGFAGIGVRQIAHHRHQALTAVHSHLGDGVAVLLVVVGDPLYLAFDLNHRKPVTSDESRRWREAMSGTEQTWSFIIHHSEPARPF